MSVDIERHRKRPVVVDTVLYDGENHYEIIAWIAEHGAIARFLFDTTEEFEIETLEGRHTVTRGDYVIKGVEDEFYPCKPAIFHATYEPADD